MPEKISEWLEDLGLSQYAEAFEENDIDWELIGIIDQQTLKDIGIGSAGHRLQILKAAKSLQKKQASPSATTYDLTPGSVANQIDDREISGWSRTPEERKPVTMLFADIVGSTALTEKLDAEEAHDLLYRATQIMCKAVESNQGTVCRFMGDGIMAMFGAPVGSERHALEACSAALDMQTGITRYADELEAIRGAHLQIRVGLHSGEVVVLEVGDDPESPEYDASGPTVPLAARMEQSADAGTILISEQTKALARYAIETIMQTPVKVKGFTEPVVVHRLNKVLSAAESSSVSARYPIAGRKSELVQFRGLVDACLENRNGQTVLVRGEAGIGKTRLVEEMARIAQDRGFAIHSALVLDFGASKGQGAIPSLARSLLGIDPGISKFERENALNQAINDDLVSQDKLIFLNDLLDLNQSPELKALYEGMDVSARKEGKRDVLVEILIKLAARKDLFIVVEDLHWADGITLDYLARLAAAVPECPVLMVLTSRVEGDSIDAAWRASAGEVPITTFDLSPLKPEESAEIISSFLDVNETLAKRCIERAAGNPLFLEQLLLSVERGVTESLPDSIRSLVLARMDQLAIADKQTLQTAAVLGQRFDLDCLRFLIGNPEYNCNSLVERHLIRPEGSLYLFSHAMIQEGAYSSMLKKQRLKIHRKAAEWYADTDPILYAEHLDYAEDLGAADAYLVAAKQQAEIYRPEKAIQIIQRGLEIAPDSRRFPFLCLKGELFRVTGSILESVEAYRLAVEVSGDDIERCDAWLGLAEGLLLNGEYQELFEVLNRAETIAKSNTKFLELARIFQIRGAAYFNQSDTDTCLVANKDSLRYARKANSQAIEAQALSGLADAEYSRGHILSALDYFDQCVELARLHGFVRVIAANLSMRGILAFWRADTKSMRTDIPEALEFAEKTHHVRAEMVALAGYAYLAEIGDLDEAEKMLNRGLELTDRLGWSAAEGIFYRSLARVAMLQGKRLKARDLAEQAVEKIRDTKVFTTFPITLGIQALVTDDPDQRHSILAEAEKLMATGGKGQNLKFFDSAIEACLQAEEWDEVDRYAQSLKDYTCDEPLPVCDLLIARGRALAEHGRGNRNSQMMEELQCLHDKANQFGLKYTLPALEAAISST